MSGIDQLTEAQILEFKQGFSLFDTKCDGKIPSKDVGAAMRSLGITITDAEALSLVHDIHREGYYSETVDLVDFLSLMSLKVRVVLDPKEELLEAFKVFDRDGTGQITIEEFKHVVSCFGEKEKMADEEIKEMIRMADVEGDGGGVPYGEFVNMIFGES